jgi:hypothetical protein
LYVISVVVVGVLTFGVSTLVSVLTSGTTGFGVSTLGGSCVGGKLQTIVSFQVCKSVLISGLGSVGVCIGVGVTTGAGFKKACASSLVAVFAVFPCLAK